MMHQEAEFDYMEFPAEFIGATALRMPYVSEDAAKLNLDMIFVLPGALGDLAIVESNLEKLTKHLNEEDNFITFAGVH